MNLQINKTYLLKALCLIASTPLTTLFAQSQVDSDTVKLHAIEMVTLTKAHDTKSHRLSPQSSDRLRHDAGEFLTQLPEISAVKKAGQYGLDPVLRGFKYEQLNIVIDGGLSAMNACPSRMDPPISQVNMNMIKEAQIFKGPYHFRYGPALGGSINFITLPTVYQENTTLSGQFSTAYESNGNLHKSEASVSLHKKDFASSIYTGYQTADSYRDGNAQLVPSGFTRYNIGSKSSFKWNPHQQTSVQLTTNQARDVDFASLSMNLLYDKTWMAQIEHQIHFEDQILKKLDVSAFGSWVNHSMGTYDFAMISDVNSQTYGARSEASLQFANMKLYTGLDFKSQSAKNKNMSMQMTGGSHSMKRDGTSWQNSTIDQIGWFNEFQTQWQNSKLSLSYRLDWDQGRAEELSDLFKSLYGDGKSTNINHSISAGYTQNLNQNTTVALWTGRAQRSPSLAERYINRFPQGLDNYEMLGNPNLKPETNFQTDLIFSYKSKNITIQTSGFYSRLTDYITGRINTDIPKSAMKSPGVRQYINLEHAFKAGFEFAAKYQLTRFLETSGALAYTYAQNTEENKPLPEIAPFEARFSLMANLNAWNMGVSLRHAAAQNRIDPSFSELPTPSFTLVNLDAQFQASKNTLVFANVTNLLNLAYSDHLSRTLNTNNAQRIHAPGRSVGLGVTTRF